VVMRRFEQGVDRLAGKFSSMLDEGADQGANFGQLVQQGGAAPSFGQLVGQDTGAPSFGRLAQQGQGGAPSFGNLAANGGSRGFDTSWLTRLGDVRAGIAAAKQNADGTRTTGSTVTATYTGLPADVAKWADQTNSTFGDLGAWVPAAMLAIIQHESDGKPGAYNGAAAGGAWGLFQQMSLGSYDPNTQFAAAKKLAQEKLAEIQKSYAANGLSPDERTRARDLFLAWAGHFDYGTGQPNQASRDKGSNEDWNAFLNGPRGIMPMYDNIVSGRHQAAAGGSGGNAGMAGITPGVGGTIMQEFGPTDYAAAHPSTYAYGNAYGLAGSQHPGVDWAVPLGTKVATPLGGTVSVVGNDHGTGYYYTNTMSGSDPNRSGEFAITLDNGDILILGHMSQINVNVGDRLSAGALIGLSGGSDGAHIHVEYRQRQADGSYRIIDPRTVLGGPTGGGGNLTP
jgi:murein DD-endopeptidase MepM/ murein hydrolase activator NlpD